MSSLQDQLLKAGLVDKNKANKAKKEKQKQANTSRKGGAKVTNEARLAAQQERDRKLERDRELNRQKQSQSNQNAVLAQIKQLIMLNRVSRDDCDLSYSFIHADKVKTIHVNEAQQKQLSLGRLAIVCLQKKQQNQCELVPTVIAEKIAQRDAQSVVQLNENSSNPDDGDDPYAQYQIPDDLMW